MKIFRTRIKKIDVPKHYEKRQIYFRTDNNNHRTFAKIYISNIIKKKDTMFMYNKGNYGYVYIKIRIVNSFTNKKINFSIENTDIIDINGIDYLIEEISYMMNDVIWGYKTSLKKAEYESFVKEFLENKEMIKTIYTVIFKHLGM